MSTTRSAQSSDRERERRRFLARIANALTDEDDPLMAYSSFVKWIVEQYGERDPSSGLKEILDEATEQFRGDVVYKTDLRYLKLWALRARQARDRNGALAIYELLVKEDIGTTYSALYEDYAALLEHAGKWAEADAVYKMGVSKAARPPARLKTRYREFLERKAVAGSSSRSGGSTTAAPRPPVSTTFNSTAEQRYALMLAPPDPTKRPEKYQFQLSMLLTEENGQPKEYSVQEARARSMGLLGKKWGPLPPTESSRASASSSSSSLSMPVDFNEDGRKTSSKYHKNRKSIMGGHEPTVTINTKEALADVFGMYNSPERTFKFAPGSKHAPVRKLDPSTPIVPPKLTTLQRSENERPIHNENAHAKTPASAFRPLRSENPQPAVTPGPSKFVPFKDDNPYPAATPGENRKTAFTTPRAAFGVKEVAPTPATRLGENGPLLVPKPPFESSTSTSAFSSSEPVISKVFTPAGKPAPLAPLRDIFSADHGPPSKAKPLSHERSRSHQDVLSSSTSGEDGFRNVFTPHVEESKTPFKVFSRPADEGKPSALSHVFTPKTPGVFSVFSDKPLGASTSAITPFRDGPAPLRPFMPKPVEQNSALQSRVLQPRFVPPPVIESEEVEEEVEEEAEEEAEEELMDEGHTPDEHEAGEEEEEQMDEGEGSYYEEEEGSRIIEYEEEVGLEEEEVQEEYEEGESEYPEPEPPLGGRFGQFNVMTPITERTMEYTRNGITPTGYTGRTDVQAREAAGRLARELRDVDEDDEMDGGIEPIRYDADVSMSDQFNLLDTLTLGSKFRPANPCNPFDASILSNLLSRIPADTQFHDLKMEKIEMLDMLNRFTKKARKSSSGSSGGETQAIVLNEHRFLVSEKLGEGGFGSVFKAKDCGLQLNPDGDTDDEDLDTDDEDEDGAASSMVALKVVKPRQIWEYHVLRRLHSALPPHLKRSVVLPHALYAFEDESYLVLDFCAQGMLLTTANNAIKAGVAQAGACLDELLVIFFTIELIRLIEGMHNCGFIHGDLKIDNCLLRLEEVPGGAAAWSAQYDPTGEGGWSYKGIKLIDFGRSIDTRLFPAGQTFIADWPVDERDCFEVRQGQPWTYQTDYFGLAGIIYCLLYGKYISASAVTKVVDSRGNERYKIATPFKRYWQTDLWVRLFDLLLNPCLVRPGGGLPVSDELWQIRAEMEQWLVQNCNRTSGTLKGLLKKVELACY